jgi:hypothetical protein
MAGGGVHLLCKSQAQGWGTQVQLLGVARERVGNPGAKEAGQIARSCPGWGSARTSSVEELPTGPDLRKPLVMALPPPSACPPELAPGSLDMK